VEAAAEQRRYRGTCVLCQKDAELRISHIIPNAIFRGIKRENSGKMITFDDAPEGKINTTIDSWSERLLCGACEMLIGRSEKVFFDTMRSTRSAVRCAHPAGVTFQVINHAALKLFFMSLLWRAAVSVQEVYSKVWLEASLKERLRTLLLAQQAAPARLFGVRVSILTDTTRSQERRLTSAELKQISISPFDRQYARSVSFVFVLEGYLAEIFVPRVTPEQVRAPGLLPSAGIWFVPFLDTFEVEELVRAFVAGVAKDMAAQALKAER
jgi:hypothetical protein